jgi:putative transposase
MKRLALKLPRWGGKRKGAGRKPNGEKAGVVHLTRACVKKGPVHVNWRMRLGTWNLRQAKCFKAIKAAIGAARDRFGMRINHFSVQGNYIHFIVEAESNDALARGMQGLGVRIAKALNRVMKKSGKRLADRYHSHVLRTPTEVRHAVRYVLKNHLKHLDSAQIGWMDDFSSEKHRAATVTPVSWLLGGRGWPRGP